MEYSLALQLSHATEIGAIAAARSAGFGDKKMADKKAVEAMRKYLNSVDFNGKVVIGEGERDEAPMLYIGEKLGTGKGKSVDIAVDPLENTNATATLGPRAISVLAASEKGGIYGAPDMYMQKLVVGPEAAGKVHLDDPPKKTLATIAKSLNREIRDLVVVSLDRDYNSEIIEGIREAGARLKLVGDGDLLPGIAACMRGTGVHALIGSGAAPEGVLTAAAVRCIKGEMQGRFWAKSSDHAKRFKKMGGSTRKIHSVNTLASGKEIIFCATGVTTGDILKGVRFFGGGARTHTLIMSTQMEKVRFIDSTHVFDKKKINYRLS